MVGMFGEDWATQELSQLQPKLRKSPLKGVAKGTTPQNALPLLFAAEHALLKLANNIEPWADTVRDAIFATHNKIDEVVTREAQGALSSGEWEAVVGGGGVHFDDGERVEWAMTNVLRGVREEWAPSLYQARSTLPDATLSDCFIDPRIVHSPIRKHPAEPNTPLLEATSHIRVQVEQTRIELLRWLGKRWLSVRQAKGFDPLEEWSLKEISDCKCALIIFFSLFLTTSRYRSAHLRLPLPSILFIARKTNTHTSPTRLCASTHLQGRRTERRCFKHARQRPQPHRRYILERRRYWRFPNASSPPPWLVLRDCGLVDRRFSVLCLFWSSKTPPAPFSIQPAPRGPSPTTRMCARAALPHSELTSFAGTHPRADSSPSFARTPVASGRIVHAMPPTSVCACSTPRSSIPINIYS